jgi:hypothetical protein
MADKKITELTALGAAPDTADILAIVDDPGGSPVTKKVTVANLLAAQTAGNLSDYNFDGNSIFGYDASINAQTGTTYTLLSSDAGKVITLDNASAITLTVPTGLGANFNCTLVQLGAGQVTISGSGTTVSNRSSDTKIAGQYGVATLLSYADTTWVLAGDTTA